MNCSVSDIIHSSLFQIYSSIKNEMNWFFLDSHISMSSTKNAELYPLASQIKMVQIKGAFAYCPAHAKCPIMAVISLKTNSTLQVECMCVSAANQHGCFVDVSLVFFVVNWSSDDCFSCKLRQFCCGYSSINIFFCERSERKFSGSCIF